MANQNIQHKYAIGTVHNTLKNGQLEVVGMVDGDYNKRVVRFINTGFQTVASLSNISKGRVKDNLVPAVCGIGYLGNCEQYDDHPMRKEIYSKWANMINSSVCYGYSLKPEQLCFADFMREELKNPMWQEKAVRKMAESMLMSFDWWEGVPKSERDGDIVWEADLRNMIDYLTNPNK
jgi:hypothetical protein